MYVLSSYLHIAYLDLGNVDIEYGKKIVIAKVSQAEDDRSPSVRVLHATELWCQSAPARLFPTIFGSRAGTCDDGQTSLHLGGQAT